MMISRCQAEAIIAKRKLTRLIGIPEAIELKSKATLSAPFGFEQIPGMLIRCGLWQSEVRINGRSFMIFTVLVRPVSQSSEQGPRRDAWGDPRRRRV